MDRNVGPPGCVLNAPANARFQGTLRAPDRAEVSNRFLRRLVNRYAAICLALTECFRKYPTVSCLFCAFQLDRYREAPPGPPSILIVRLISSPLIVPS